MSWLDDRIAKEEDQVKKKMLEAGQILIDYFFDQLNGVGLTTQPVKKADPNLPADFRG